MSVNCGTNLETTRVSNNSSQAVTIKTVGSVYRPCPNGPLGIGYRLRPNRAIMLESGCGADSDRLHRRYPYNGDAGTGEGAGVSTSVGRFVDER